MIDNLQIEIVELSTMQVQLRITCDLTSQLELRGRVHGPHSPETETVSIAYPIHFRQRQRIKCIGECRIPEPNFWTERMPFTYQVQLELWQDGQRVDQQIRCIAFREPC